MRYVGLRDRGDGLGERRSFRDRVADQEQRASVVVVERMLAGAVEGPIDGTFSVECFDRMLTASTRFDAIESEQMPILVTTPDGGMLVVCLHETQTIGRRRSVR